LALPLVAILLYPPLARAQQPALEYEGAAALGLELRRLGTTKRVLMIGAHPDDESTQILSTLALGQGATVAYLALTRGEGGQNGIGPELQEGLGLLRTEELLAARRLDGARQYFTRAYDFGFSRNEEEAFSHWPREEILGDVVAAIRDFRPDIVLSVFSGTPADGHGQHQVAGTLAREGFEAAGDPARFPEQIAAGLHPFAPAKLYQALWGRNDDAGTRLETGELDPLLGSSYYQIAMASRSRHRSQDMGRPLTPGPQASALELTENRSGAADAAASLFGGIDTTLSARAAAAGAASDEGNELARALPLLRDYERTVLRLRDGFNPLALERTVSELAEALRILRAALATIPAGGLRAAAASELGDAERALWSAARLELDALVDDETVVPGQPVTLTVTLWNGGRAPVAVRRLEPALPAGWTVEAAEPVPAELLPGALATRRFRVTVAGDAAPTRPYFLHEEREGDLYSWPAGRMVGVPFEGPAVHVVAEVDVAGQTLESGAEGTFQEVDRRQGEFRRPVRVVPAVSVLVSPGIAVVPLGPGADRAPLGFEVRLRSEAPRGMSGTLALHPPAAVPVRFTQPGETRSVEVRLTPPARLAEGEAMLGASFVAEGGGTYDEGFTLVDYPHIRPHALFDPARTRVRAFPVAVPSGLRVGYVEGAGDEAPQALRQLGVEVTPLDAAALAAGDFAGFDAILTGIRAYEVRPDLVAHNRRLLEYAERGGTVVVQYNKYEYTEPGIAPWPVEMARPHDRVTDETAGVRLLDPSHQALSWPNRITDADFAGWSQERGLYFLSEWGDRFTPLLEMADPGEEPTRGSLLVSDHGEGKYVYTGLAFFRQLPEGVPGAYRLLVNLLSLGRQP
jgi:LmbE family N-acetylglucosaminyl deacetylase